MVNDIMAPNERISILPVNKANRIKASMVTACLSFQCSICSMVNTETVFTYSIYVTVKTKSHYNLPSTFSFGKMLFTSYKTPPGFTNWFTSISRNSLCATVSTTAS